MPGLNLQSERLTWDSPYEEYAGHPRAAGTHATVLRVARENDVPLMHSLSQLSYWHARHLGDTGLIAMQERGRMQEGMVADITIFDAGHVTEHLNYKAGLNRYQKRRGSGLILSLLILMPLTWMTAY